MKKDKKMVKDTEEPGGKEEPGGDVVKVKEKVVRIFNLSEDVWRKLS